MTSRPIRVLIADDHQMFREGLRRLLETEADIKVVGEACDGNEVLRLVADVPADILLLDLSMPRASGFDALQRLSELGATIRTIVVTGVDDREQVVRAIRLGARGVIVKDTPVDLLARSIRQVAQGQYWIGHERMADLLDSIKGEAAPVARPVETLTRRELQIIAAVVQGETNKGVGQQLGVSDKTVKNHLSAIYDKLGVSTRLELAMFALNHRLLSDDRSES
jgi:DNA-binding NarL/FixJ family response regulator